jgi:DNA-binding transcriptional ArsR family regulator
MGEKLNKYKSLPDFLLRDIVEIFKALSDPTRAQLVYLLTKREMSVNELSEKLPVSSSAVSHHLAKLRTIRLVNNRREGNQVFYSIDDSHVRGLFNEAIYNLDHIHNEIPDSPYSDIAHHIEEET